MNIDLSLPVSAELLIPHRAPLCLVDRIIEFEDRSGTVESVVAPDSLLLSDDGYLDRLAMVELLAQSYAAVKGYADQLHGKPVKRGFFVGIRRIRFDGRARAGDRLRIRVETVSTLGDFSVVEGEVLREGEVIAAGSIKLWISEDE